MFMSTYERIERSRKDHGPCTTSGYTLTTKPCNWTAASSYAPSQSLHMPVDNVQKRRITGVRSVAFVEESLHVMQNYGGDKLYYAEVDRCCAAE